MSKNEYYKIAPRLIPQEIIYKYNLMDKKIKGFIYVRVEKGMYDLFQAGIISHTSLKKHLHPFRYEPTCAHHY